MTKSELNDCGLIWNTSKHSICLDDFLKRYDGISKDITIESKPNSYNVISETLHGMGDVRNFLTRMMTCKIQLTKVEFEESTIICAYPEIHVEYFISTDTTVTGTLEMPNTGYVDTCSHDDTLENLKREIDRQLMEELERSKIKEEPKEETVLQFKEISW